MGYEYKEEIENHIICAPVHVYDEVFDELDEVYAKAKAWQTLKEEMITEYPYLVRGWESTNGEGEHAEMCKANEILERMDQIDGTHEFSNILHDINRSERL